jgi:hypothetical protein
MNKTNIKEMVDSPSNGNDDNRQFNTCPNFDDRASKITTMSKS